MADGVALEIVQQHDGQAQAHGHQTPEHNAGDAQRDAGQPLGRVLCAGASIHLKPAMRRKMSTGHTPLRPAPVTAKPTNQVKNHNSP